MGGRRQKETAAAKAKDRNCGDRSNGGGRNKGGDHKGGRNGDRNRDRNGDCNGDRNAKPTTVTPSTVTPTTMAVDNPKMVINAFTDTQIWTWDPVFKASLEKAKSEMPKTYQELEILMRVLDSISNHMSVGHNSKEKLEIMRTALKVQFNNYEISWENSMGYISGDALFDEFQELYSIADEAVDKASKALLEAKKFLRENSTQNLGTDTPPADSNFSANNRTAKPNTNAAAATTSKTTETMAKPTTVMPTKVKGLNGRDRNKGADRNKGRDCNNGRDRNNGGYRNGDAKNVQKCPKSSKKTKKVQECSRAYKKVQERPSRAKTVVPEMYLEQTKAARLNSRCQYSFIRDSV